MTGGGWRRRLLPILALAVVLAGLGAGYGPGDPADTAVVILTEGRTGEQAWRLEGQRRGGDACVSLVLAGQDRPAADRCGMRRTTERRLDPAIAAVDERLLVFSPVASRARRVRLDGADGSIRILPARRAPGFPARFFVADVEPRSQPIAVRVFAEHGRSIIA